jgi:hypothetical protein
VSKALLTTDAVNLEQVADNAAESAAKSARAAVIKRARELQKED